MKSGSISFINIKTDKSTLWIGMLITLCVVTGFLFYIGVPQKIITGFKAQSAMHNLYDLRHQLYELKSTTTQFSNINDFSYVDNKFKDLTSSSTNNINKFAQVGSYNKELSSYIDLLSVAVSTWIASEEKYLKQYIENDGLPLSTIDEMALEVLEHDNNALFLKVVQLLNAGELPIIEDIQKSRSATKVLVWTGILIIASFFLVTMFHQRISHRQHLIRDANLEMTMRSIGDAVIATDLTGEITCMSPEAERLTGWSIDDAIGFSLNTVFTVINEESGEPINDIVERVKTEKSIVVIKEKSKLIAANGDVYHIHENGAPIFGYTGELIGVLLVFRDITEPHTLQNDLRHTIERLQSVVDTSMDAVIVTDENGKVEEWNPAAEKMFGWTREEINKRPIHESIIPNELREAHLQGVARLKESDCLPQVSKRIESVGLHKDGHQFPIELAMTSIKKRDGWIFSAFIRDLSELRKSGSELHRKNIFLREAQRIAKIGYWELDIATNKLFWTDDIYHLFGLDPDKDTPSYELFLSKIPIDERDYVNNAYTESLKTKQPYNVVHRIMGVDGIKVVSEHCETVYDDFGNPLRSLGVVQDISEQVDQTNELRLAATTFNTHAGIIITDERKRMLRVNPAILKMTGYSEEELIGETPKVFQSGEYGKEFYLEMWEEIDATGIWSGELWNKRKDGTRYAQWLTITAVYDDNGTVINYVGTSQDITTRKNAESQVAYQAYHDDLTGLANRRLLRDRLDIDASTCRRHNEVGAFLLLDLDNFKNLNDSYGHTIGDEILCKIAKRLETIVRDSDTVARLGGDEFVVLLPSVGNNMTDASYKAQTIAEKIRQVISKPYKLDSALCHITVSIGISLFPEQGENNDDILKHTDTALYKAKAQGRNSICFYLPQMQQDVDERLAISEGLHTALENNELCLYYQPQMNSKGMLVGAEALIRWNHPEKGLIPPDKFIPIAEESGLIMQIGDWVLNQVVKQITDWNSNGVCNYENIRVAINVSPKQFHQKKYVEQTLQVINQSDILFDCIDIEVTENLLMHNIDDVVEKMKELRNKGIRISIDDFGTGYSSLAYLKKLPLDQLKIDQSFIRDVLSSTNDAVVVETIISMAKHLGLEVIAEGVETKEQLEFLQSKGCHDYQGYYFNQPLAATDFSRFLQKQHKQVI